MTEDELMYNVKDLLRKAIATRIGMPQVEYDGSLDNKNAVNIFLTDVMSIAYNKGDMDAVLEELCTLHHYGEEKNPEVIAFVRKQIHFAQTKLNFEIAAFSKFHEMSQAGAAQEAIWAQIQSMVIIGEDYKTDIQP
jgi:hypothetical protein